MRLSSEHSVMMDHKTEVETKIPVGEILVTHLMVFYL